ncbi:K(+)-transporting ATPase subunit C [Pectinatus haikarae]|uniref:Potassium-transporting ATPase KdpC subunit n=1 Tax=Pectinatus haikarae TaxID=349096 RepID=A0ABT9YB00_9FIRM|nr:K(+)-transporting ATPase subunit C [Pectinatus haikarae]MDQ0205009.1 K+-transporting ATPase ATPase C chain [Pectinatus haikarae]
MSAFLKEIKTQFMITIVLLLLCGLVYPLLLTGISQLFFPSQANGSLIVENGHAVGSELIGQDFSDPRFMKNRPSAVNYNTYTQEEKDGGDYTGVSSGSKNFAPTNPDLTERVTADIMKFTAVNPTINKEDIPADLLTSSGSGLDPHISPKSAAIQIPALVRSTGLSREILENIVKKNTQNKLLGIFGEETVNVLKVNLEIAKVLRLSGQHAD